MRQTLAMKAPSPALVLYAEHPATTRRFYEALGFRFRAERHGKGPRHVAGTLDGFVLEIYPRPSSTDGRHACHHVRIAIPVADAQASVSALASAVGVVVWDQDLRKRGTVRVWDPDRVTVILVQH